MMREEMLVSPPTPPPPGPLSPVLYPIESSPNTVSDHRNSYNPSLLIIAGIIAAAVIAAASIHLLFRVLSRSRSSSDPFLPHLSSSTSTSSSSSSSSSSSASASSNKEEDPKAVIDSLPLFSLASSTAKPTSSLDCAVCLSPFSLTDQLRLLPLCRHAFHSQCIDTWLRSNLSCPLCRSPIGPVPSPPDPLPSRSESFRVEIGSVSRRISTSADPNTAASSTYSIGSSFEYVVDEEIDAVLSRVRRRPTEYNSDLAPPPPGTEVAEVAGASHRSWLKDYVDRLASSASSSFSSWRFSQRGSNRIDSDGSATGGGEDWDLERNLHLHLEEEDGGFSAFYRWLIGV